MQRGMNIHFAALTLSLAVSASLTRPAHAAPPAVPGAPAGWVHEDIGGPGAAGDSSATGTGAATVFTVTGSGADIQGSADQFQYAYTTLTGDGGITARILSQTGMSNDPTWTKTGVMLRETDDAGSRMATYNLTSGSGSEVGYRMDTDGSWSGFVGDNGAGQGRHSISGLPLWLRVQHKGTDFQVLSSDDGKTWRLVDHTTIAMDVTKPILAGLDVTAHSDGNLATATYDNVSVDNNIIAGAPPGPGGLQATASNGAVLLTFNGAPNAVGYNIYRSAAGNINDTPVLVNSTPTPYTWFIDDGAGKGLTNGTGYLYEVRGVVADSAGNMTETIGSNFVAATPNAPVLGALTTYNIGTFNPGSVSYDSAKKVINVRASGGEFWDNNDSQTFAATAVDGDFTATAKLLAPPTKEDAASSNSGKIGLLMREGLEIGAPYAFVFASVMRDPEILFEGRRVPFGNATSSDAFPDDFSGGQTSFANLKFPVFIRMTRRGTVMNAQESTDGTNWTDETAAQDYARMPLTTYVGIGATALTDGSYIDGQIDGASFSITTP
jgi:regulation of enolase protein 1 (concanavalin A-like superfamily)